MKIARPRPGWVGFPELSERTGLPERYLRELADLGKIPWLTVGRRRLFHPDSVERALVARQSPPPLGSGVDAEAESESEGVNQ